MASSNNTCSTTSPPSPPSVNSRSPSRACLCAPTTHPGSFRCSLHRNYRRLSGRSAAAAGGYGGSSSASRIESKTKSMRALLMQIIRPSSHDLYRRRNFQPKPTRFGVMNGSDHQSVAVV